MSLMSEVEVSTLDIEKKKKRNDFYRVIDVHLHIHVYVYMHTDTDTDTDIHM